MDLNNLNVDTPTHIYWIVAISFVSVCGVAGLISGVAIITKYKDWVMGIFSLFMVAILSVVMLTTPIALEKASWLRNVMDNVKAEVKNHYGLELSNEQARELLSDDFYNTVYEMYEGELPKYFSFSLLGHEWTSETIEVSFEDQPTKVVLKNTEKGDTLLVLKNSQVEFPLLRL